MVLGDLVLRLRGDIEITIVYADLYGDFCEYNYIVIDLLTIADYSYLLHRRVEYITIEHNSLIVNLDTMNN